MAVDTEEPLLVDRREDLEAFKAVWQQSDLPPDERKAKLSEIADRLEVGLDEEEIKRLHAKLREIAAEHS